MTLFFDRDMGRTIPEALRALDLDVERHDDHLDPRTKDEQWLEEIGRRGWPVISRDQRLLRNQSARRALADNKVGCFVLFGAGNKPRWFAVRIIARNWDDIEHPCRSENRPFLYRLYLARAPKREELPGHYSSSHIWLTPDEGT